MTAWEAVLTKFSEDRPVLQNLARTTVWEIPGPVSIGDKPQQKKKLLWADCLSCSCHGQTTKKGRVVCRSWQPTSSALSQTRVATRFLKIANIMPLKKLAIECKTPLYFCCLALVQDICPGHRSDWPCPIQKHQITSLFCLLLCLEHVVIQV